MILINKETVTEDGRQYEVTTEESELTGEQYVTKTYIPTEEETIAMQERENMPTTEEQLTEMKAENENLKAQVAQTNTDLAAFMDYYFSNTP